MPTDPRATRQMIRELRYKADRLVGKCDVHDYCDNALRQSWLDESDRLRAEANKLELRLTDQIAAWPQKIFTHKYLDPQCIERGCQSVTIQVLTERLAAMRNLLLLDHFENSLPDYREVCIDGTFVCRLGDLRAALAADAEAKEQR